MHGEKAQAPRDGEAIALTLIHDPEAAKRGADAWLKHLALAPRDFWERSLAQGAESFEDAVNQWADEGENLLGKVVTPSERAHLVSHLRNTLLLPAEPWTVDSLGRPGEFFVRGCADEMDGNVQALIALAPRLLRLLQDTLIGNNPEAQREAFELVMRYRKWLP